MPPSDRFKPIHKLATHNERKAATELGESLRQRESARLRLDELRGYLAEYLERFERAAREGLPSSQVLEYQVFIGKLEAAIEQQAQAVSRSEQQCDSSKAHWRGRYTKSKAMETVIERMVEDERREKQRREQAESDERSQRKR